MRAKRMLAVGLVGGLLLVGGPVAVWAGGAAGNAPAKQAKHAAEQRPIREAIQKLNLTPDQKKQVHQIFEDQREAFNKYRQDHADEFKKATEDLKAARRAKDHAKIKAAREALRKLYEAGPNLKGLAEKVRAVLTTDQQKTFDEEMASIRQRMKQHVAEAKSKENATKVSERDAANAPKDGASTP